MDEDLHAGGWTKKIPGCANRPVVDRIQRSVQNRLRIEETVCMRREIVPVMLLMVLCGTAIFLQAGDVRINLPKSSHLTPVQALNRDGIKALRRGHIDKAKQVFVRAYLLDPEDPFTLNNLGYVSELEGDADQALKYYQLAANISTEAVIDEASHPGLKGQPVSAAFSASRASAFSSNKANVQAMVLLERGRVFEAESLLQNALQRDPKNPFLLDSLGYVMESEGDLQGALRYYSSAASLHSEERVMLTPRAQWRGRSISEVAAQSARAVSETIAQGDDTGARVARLNLQGVSALNHNDAPSARKFFLEAYKLDPANAFTLNNIGYLAELGGDRESAEMYYEAAGGAVEANDRVTYATRPDAEGRRVGNLAENSRDGVESTLKTTQEAKRRVRRPIELKRRDEAIVPEDSSRPQPPLGVPSPALPPLEPPHGSGTPPASNPPPQPETQPSPQPDRPPR